MVESLIPYIVDKSHELMYKWAELDQLQLCYSITIQLHLEHFQ